MYNPKQTGFFPILQLKVEESLSDREKRQFQDLQTIEEKLKWLAKLPRLSSDHQDNVLRDFTKLDFGEKSSQKSVHNREAGNAQFYSGNFKQAQILYSVAVFTAPGSGSPDLALALANRSACFQKLGGYQMALRDIELALSEGYPQDKAFKLVERRGECQMARGEKVKALDSFQMAIKMIKKNAGLKGSQREKFIAAIEKKMEKASQDIERESQCSTAAVTNGENENNNNDSTDLFVEDRSENYESAHSSVEIKYEEGRGRFAVASRDIEIGTVLFRERPLTYTLNPEKFGTNCQHCFAPIRGVIPCTKCTWVCFCSPECRSKANDSYHQYECGIIKLLLESGLNVYAYMALRLVTREGLPNLLKIKDDLELHRSEKKAASEEKKFYSSKDFRNAYNLMAHEDSIPEDMWLLRGLVAFFLLKCLQQTAFFDQDEEQEKADANLTANEIFVGKLLFRLLNVMPCNSHDISEFETPVMDTFVPGCKKVSVGAGLYPCLALLNHSCEPSFMRCNKGNEVICVASKTIRKGEEICENYGLMYTIKDFKERQRILKDHYKFDCGCPPCSEGWPLLGFMKEEVREDPEDKRMSRFVGIKCVHCGSTVKRKGQPEPFNPVRTCVVCGKTTHLWQDIPLDLIKKLSSEASQSLVKGRWSQGLLLAKETEALVSKHFCQPLLELTEVQISIWKCLWLSYGSMRLVKSL